MRGILANLLIKLGLDSKEFEKGVDGAKQKTNAFVNNMKRVGGMIAGVFAVDRIIAFGRELLNLSGQIEGVRSAFMRMADPTTLNELKDATAGTVSELNLMKRAVMAKNFGIPVEQLGKLLEFASKRAQDTGQSVDYLVDSIVIGIGRKSPLILDNLGISIQELRKRMGGMSAETATVAELTKVVADIAAESMRESGKIIDTNAIKIQRLGAQWDDFKNKISTSPGTNAFFKNELEELSDNMEVFFSKNLSKWEKFLAFIDITGRNTEKLAKKSKQLNEEEEKRNKQRDEYIRYMQQMGDLGKKEEQRALTKEELDKLEEKRKEALKRAQDIYNQSIQTEIDLITKLKALTDNYNPLSGLESAVPDIQSGFSDIFKKFGLKEETEYFAGITTDLGGGKIGAESFDTKAYKKRLDDFNQFKEDMAYAVADFGVNVVEEFGQSLGEMIASGNFDFSDFGKNILAGIGGFISQLGKMLIGLGIASEAFQALLKSAFTNPVSAGLAIAAGAALVLLGGAIQGFAKAGPTGSGSSSSVSTPSYSRAESTSQGYRAEDNKVVFEIKGDKLVGVLNNVQRKNLNMA